MRFSLLSLAQFCLVSAQTLLQPAPNNMNLTGLTGGSDADAASSVTTSSTSVAVCGSAPAACTSSLPEISTPNSDSSTSFPQSSFAVSSPAAGDTTSPSPDSLPTSIFTFQPSDTDPPNPTLVAASAPTNSKNSQRFQTRMQGTIAVGVVFCVLVVIGTVALLLRRCRSPRASRDSKLLLDPEGAPASPLSAPGTAPHGVFDTQAGERMAQLDRARLIEHNPAPLHRPEAHHTVHAPAPNSKGHIDIAQREKFDALTQRFHTNREPDSFDDAPPGYKQFLP
ncbi:hypothetical protein FB451DRAFT_1364463 [Mycena latifolia]|nr:hypothetical protein FB451DRAFT_1364463 [Mycena latifolia]